MGSRSHRTGPEQRSGALGGAAGLRERHNGQGGGPERYWVEQDRVCRKCPGGKAPQRRHPIIEEKQMAKSSDDIPEIEEPDPLDPEDAADVAPLDSEIDFDDEQ